MRFVKTVALLVTTLILAGSTNAGNAQVLAGTGSYYGPAGFDRGFQATQYCGNNPESWIRGNAWLDKQTGLLTMQINLETDATHAGPKGQVFAYVLDEYNNLITRVVSTEVGMGGKPPGNAVQNTFQASFFLGPQVGQRAAKVVVVPSCTGSRFQLWGVSLSTALDAAGLVQQFGIMFF